MLDFLFGILVTLVLLILGGIILLAGRRSLAATLGIVALSATGNLLASLFFAYDSGRELIENGQWVFVLIAIAVGVLGGLIGLRRRFTAIAVLGFIAGVYIALWFDNVVSYFTNNQTILPNNSENTLILLIVLIGGLIGLYLARKFPEEAIILIAVLVGEDVISIALKLDSSTVWTAIIILSLTLAGIVVQYADYLRQLKGDTPLGEWQPIMAEAPITEQFDL